MARKAELNYWPSRGGYGATVNYQQQVFAKGPKDEPDGPTYKAAVAAFAKAVALQSDYASMRYLVSAAINQYRLTMATKPRRLGEFDSLMSGLSDLHGDKPCGSLAPALVDRWIDSRGDWAEATKAKVGRNLMCVFNYCVASGVIPENPLKDRHGKSRLVKRETPRRGAEAVYEDADMDMLEAEVLTYRPENRALWWLFRLLRHTGARPGEIMGCRAFNLQHDRILYRWDAKVGFLWKNARKTKRHRQVCLSPELAEHARRCAKTYPDGPIFRACRGGEWYGSMIAHALRRLRIRPRVVAYCRERGIDPADIRLYNYRHTWITRYVERTGDIWGAAQLCGTSVKMIEQRYCHPNDDQLAERYQNYMRATGRG